MNRIYIVSTLILSMVGLLIAACSSDDDGQNDLLTTYRGHLQSAGSAVSDRWNSKTNDEQYRDEINEHMSGMETVREDMLTECNRVDGCPHEGGIGGRRSDGHMDEYQMLTHDEMKELQRGEQAMQDEMHKFDSHCRGMDVSNNTCESYRENHLDNMSTMLGHHDDMCSQMMMQGWCGDCNNGQWMSGNHDDRCGQMMGGMGSGGCR